MRRHVWLSFALALFAYAVPSDGQQTSRASDRVALQARAVPPESAAASNRSHDGTFHPGDRITVSVAGEPSLSNTFTVRTGNILTIPSLEDISLQGVKRSELRGVVTREVSRYIKDPEVRVSTLINIAVLGAIARPGFYAVAPDTPITDVLMSAGGPLANSDFGRTRILRDGAAFAEGTKVRRMLDGNGTFDDLGLQSGDQILIGQSSNRWQSVTPILGVVSVLATIVVLVRPR